MVTYGVTVALELRPPPRLIAGSPAPAILSLTRYRTESRPSYSCVFKCLQTAALCNPFRITHLCKYRGTPLPKEKIMPDLSGKESEIGPSEDRTWN
jgi:hypothetical protein